MSNESKRMLTAKFLVLLITITFLSLVATSCSGESVAAADALTDYLKAQGVIEVKTDIFVSDPNTSERAYIAATLTHNFATAEGNLQKEYAGYILTKSDGKWTINERTKYTKETDKAILYLSGSK